MKWGVLFIVALTCSCNYKTGYIKHGTTILCFVDKDSIVMAADSRVTVTVFNGNDKPISHFTDTTNKIHNIGNYFFAIAGPQHLGALDFADKVKQYYDPNKSPRDNLLSISVKIKHDLDSVVKTFNKTQFDYVKNDIAEINLTVVIAGYDNDEPFTYKFGVLPRISSDNIVIDDVRYDTGGVRTVSMAGKVDEITKLHNVSEQLKKGMVNCLSWMISLEAKSDNDVDSVVHYVVIKKDISYRGVKDLSLMR